MKIGNSEKLEKSFVVEKVYTREETFNRLVKIYVKLFSKNKNKSGV